MANEMNITEVDDLTQFCRVCLQVPEESELLDLNLIYDEEEQLSYYDCFTVCTQINLSEGEGLPQNLCRSCGMELQIAYDFYKKVEDSKRFLAQIHEHQAGMSSEDMIDETSQAVSQDIEQEEHLEIEEFQAVEQLEEEDAETIQIKINTKCDGEGDGDGDGDGMEYVIEAITLADDDEMETTANKLKEQMTWEDAVVTVANEEHLPVKSETAQIKEEESEGQLNTSNTTRCDYESEEILPYECENDTKKFKSDDIDKQNYTAHVRARYSGKFHCDYCQKAFKNHSRMMLHRRSHEPDRPKFHCPDCDRLYATKQAMEVHIRTVHIKNGFVCPICSKLYAIKKSLEVHMRYHTGDFPYVCDLCGKKYAQIGHLNTHKNVKHNSVRFSCEYPNCGKFFTSSTSLRNHEFSHGDMPFQCSYCEKGYPSKSKLKVHIRRTHDVELTLEQLEPMRKFKTTRSKLSLVVVEECEN